MSDPTDYKALFFKAEGERKQEAVLRKKAEEERKRAEGERKRAEEERKRAEGERERREKERTQQTTFEEFARHCHILLARPLRVESPEQSTTGKIPPPTGKYCPLQLRPWTDCVTRQQEIYNSVCRYLQPVGRDAPRLFAPLLELEGISRRVARRAISSE
ncbi:hypothetical protein BO71DRAFT_99999 [Aspergillus ellipticus CBS 707.79]|uniref:Uncharacterized protein n=1 Tax=Aspergillus ellipticus CBS 707.79 TaxID=1448320 RepID=A0A319DNZ0_9EURO|nr:hypothetical protein BO71DRAFT_99999 [Aspergillus ellipticus CBS 707.79]